MKRITKIDEVTKTKNKLKVVAYCRVSSGLEFQLLSLETQKAHYESYIKSNPEWEYAGIYYDEGITGTKKDSRPQLMKLIADCEHGLVGFAVGRATVEAIKKHDEVKEQMKRDEEAHQERMKQIKAKQKNESINKYFNCDISKFSNFSEDYYKGFGIEIEKEK